MKNLILKWLEKLACRHKWKVHHASRHYASAWNKMPYKTQQTLICEECGKIKKITL